MKIVCRKTKEVAHSYQKYLSTKHWRALRQKALDTNVLKACAWCGESLDFGWVLHHKTYKRLGRERLTDVECVCTRDTCHNGRSKMHRLKHQRTPKFAKINSKRKSNKFSWILILFLLAIIAILLIK